MLATKMYVRSEKDNALMLRITNGRKKAELSLGFHISEDEYADILAGKPSCKNQQLASLISIWQGRLAQIKIDLLTNNQSHLEAAAIRDLIKNSFFGSTPNGEKEELVASPEDGTFAHYFNGFAEKKSNQRTKSIYLATFSRMEMYDSDLGKRNFEDITIRWLSDFETFLAKTSPSANARNIHFRNIRTVFNAAIDEELTSHYPFRRFKIRPVPTRKRSLSEVSIRKVFAGKGLETWEIKYLDFFKLSFMLIGMNVVDLCNLTEVTDGRVEYVRAKTHKPYSIKVEPEAMELIKRHRGTKRLLNFAENYTNYRYFYNNLCKGLASIKDKLGIKELTTYWARHTWSTIAADLDVPDAVISQALGHSGANSTTEIYIYRNQKKVDRANRMVLDWVLYGKKTLW